MYGPPVPPLPAPPTQQPPPSQFDTSAWGVRYNHGAAQQQYHHHEQKPPLPPRPPSATGRVSSPRPDHAGASNYPSQQAPPNAGSTYHVPQPSQHYPTSWNDPYPLSPPQPPPPPPPPPRPAEYEAQIQAQYNRVNNTPHPEYSYRPTSHHYDPLPENAWAAQSVSSTAPAYHPTAPAPQQVSATVDGPLVSPVESGSGLWGRQGQTTNNDYHNHTAQRIDGNSGHAPALSFGGPSDWEHYDPGRPQDDEGPTSPAAPPAEQYYHAQGPFSPAQSNAQQDLKPDTSAGAPAAVEIGAPSPITPHNRRQSHAQHASIVSVETPESQINGRPSSSGDVSGDLSKQAAVSNYDSVSQTSTAPLPTPPVQDEAGRPDSRASGRVLSPEPLKSVKVVDPYADLEPEFRASLNRYAGMLRKESAAETEEDKFKIFQTFVLKELRLRSLLYGVELNPEREEVKKAASLADIQALLPNAVDVTSLSDPSRDSSTSPTVTGPIATSAPKAPSPQPQVNGEPTQPPTATNTAPTEQLEPQPAASTDVEPRAHRPSVSIHTDKVPGPKHEQPAEVKTDDDEEEAYSPGGRPKINRTIPPTATAKTQPSMVPTSPDQSCRSSPDPISSPNGVAPVVSQDYATANPPSPGSNAPILVVSEPAGAASGQEHQTQKPVVPIKFEPPRPVYTPFRYNAAIQDEPPKALQPADQAYSSLRHSVADSGRLMAQEALFAPARPASAIGRKEHEEAFIGLIRQQSMAVRQKTPGPPQALSRGGGAEKAEPPLAIRVGTPHNAPVADSTTQAMTALRSLLPSDPSLDASQHPKLKTIKSRIDAAPDQFGFIHEAVVDWDRTNREVRKQQDAERRRRQEESEAHIDALFNDNEIGYADIGDLEAEFKLAEAERRYHENKEELDSFTAQVFAPVTERLEKEIAELTTAYTLAIDLLDLESASACLYFKSGKEKPLMSDVMSCLLCLFNKIEVRHRKVAEAHVERERRRKRLELTVLYTNGDTAGVKQVERDFATAEKTQVLHEAREKDIRANMLMDAFDRATVRGLGDNQMFVDDVLAKLQDLSNVLLSAETPSGDRRPDLHSVQETLSLAQGVVEALMADSRKLLALSNEAEAVLNDADYAVSVAEARMAHADKVTYSNLETEKAKEDAKLIEEMNSRISSVTKGPSEAVTLIRELVDRIGGGPEHQERIRKALEAAKQRNASMAPAPP